MCSRATVAILTAAVVVLASVAGSPPRAAEPPKLDYDHHSEEEYRMFRNYYYDSHITFFGIIEGDSIFQHSEEYDETLARVPVHLCTALVDYAIFDSVVGLALDGQEHIQKEVKLLIKRLFFDLAGVEWSPVDDVKPEDYQAVRRGVEHLKRFTVDTIEREGNGRDFCLNNHAEALGLVSSHQLTANHAPPDIEARMRELYESQAPFLRWTVRKLRHSERRHGSGEPPELEKLELLIGSIEKKYGLSIFDPQPDRSTLTLPAGALGLEAARAVRQWPAAKEADPAWDWPRTLVFLIQSALVAEGHDPGPRDGLMGPATMLALLAWDAASGPPADRDDRRSDMAHSVAFLLHAALAATGLAPGPAERFVGPESEAVLDEWDDLFRARHIMMTGGQRAARQVARQQIEKLEGTTPTPPVASAEEVESSLGLARSKRRMVQHGLASLGYAPGTADGLFGKRTREAIRRYQGAKGLETTGYLTAEQSQALVALGAEAVRADEAERRETRRRADDAAYAAAKSAGTMEAYASYLDSYPSGQYVAEVRRLRAEAQRVERTRREQAPGRRFRDCPQCPEMVVVPAGSYMMGSPTGEEGRHDDESPVHRVRIANPFAVGVHEVTRGEFARFVRETGHSAGNGCYTYEGGEWKERTGRNWRRPGFGQTDGQPVVCVDWNDAQSYVRWLSRETGERYRLLSESEWEYVARAGTRTSRHWGDRASDACRYANVADRSAKEKYANRTIHECRDGHVHTAAVGSFSANPYGLHDALGNVWEWVADCWNDSYTGAPGDGRAWTRGDCDRRVVRGGSWINDPRILRSANRNWDDTGFRSNLGGFRVARTLN